MTLKDQEQQLTNDLVTKNILSIIFWLALAGIALYRLLSLKPPVTPSTTNSAIPTLEQENINALRSSIKTPPQITNIPVIKPEPFD